MFSCPQGRGSAMPVTRRQIIAAIPAAAVAASLPRAPAMAQDGRKVVTFWFAQANADGQAALRSNLVNAFNASQDKYLLQLEVKGAAVNNLLKVALLAGNGPDIVQTSGPSYLTGIANAGHLLPLDDFAARYKWKERFLSTLLNTGVYGDKLYALPRDYESMHLFYNKQLFASDAAVDAFFTRRMTAGDGYTIQRFIDSIVHGEDVLDNKLSAIKHATLIVWGREDGLTPLAMGERFKKEIAGSELLIIEKCGHVPQLEKAAEFNAALMKFLEGAKR